MLRQPAQALQSPQPLRTQRHAGCTHMCTLLYTGLWTWHKQPSTTSLLGPRVTFPTSLGWCLLCARPSHTTSRRQLWLPHTRWNIAQPCEADENCNGFVLGGGTPLSPDGNCTFVVTPPSALISSSSHGPLVKRPSFFLKAGEPVPALPKSASPPPSPPAPPAYPRPLGPSCEVLSAIQTRSGCTNQTCMLVVEVEFSGTQTKLWNNVHRVSFAVSVSEAPRR